jgi:hypothetical protein
MVRLQLHALAYNLSNFLRTLATPEPIKDWSLIATSSSKWPRSPSHGKCFKRFCGAHRGTAAAATTSASVRRSMSCILKSHRRMSNARENGQIRSSTKRLGYPKCW